MSKHMKVSILGIDGYIGWALALRLIGKGHQVVGVDSLYTRMRVKEVGSQSVTPIESMENRIKILREKTGENIEFFQGDCDGNLKSSG